MEDEGGAEVAALHDEAVGHAANDLSVVIWRHCYTPLIVYPLIVKAAVATFFYIAAAACLPTKLLDGFYCTEAQMA
jgi:hypothetical protein